MMLTALFSRAPWAALLYVVVAVPLALVGFVGTVVLLLLGAVLTVTPLGLWVIALTTRCANGLGALHRGLARLLLGVHVGAPPDPGGRGLLHWRRRALTDPSGWRAVAYALVKLPVAVLTFVLAAAPFTYGALLLSYPVTRRWNGNLSIGGHRLDTVPRALVVCVAGLLLLVGGAYLIRYLVTPDVMLMRGLLGPSTLQARVRDLEERRAYAISDATATLRRIERDLHDGTQARLVALGMKLALIEGSLTGEVDVPRARELAGAGRQAAKTAVTELRELVRGFHPPILDDGLEAAVATLAAQSVVPVELAVDLQTRPTPAIEAIAYFCAAELLTNIAKHSGATRAALDVRRSDGVLRLRVSDDGRGGARTRAGSGLTGLSERVRTVDGRLDIDSPPGGPTVVTVEIPSRA
jgi:signal transduction histidine kinase